MITDLGVIQRLEICEPFLLTGQFTLHHGLDQHVLGTEIMVEMAHADAAFLGNSGNAGTVEALFHEMQFCAVQDFGEPIFTFGGDFRNLNISHAEMYPNCAQSAS